MPEWRRLRRPTCRTSQQSRSTTFSSLALTLALEAPRRAARAHGNVSLCSPGVVAWHTIRALCYAAKALCYATKALCLCSGRVLACNQSTTVLQL
eukprot:scaffold20933_cov20-Tisochrysis_lutea.AAC.2